MSRQQHRSAMRHEEIVGKHDESEMAVQALPELSLELIQAVFLRTYRQLGKESGVEEVFIRATRCTARMV